MVSRERKSKYHSKRIHETFVELNAQMTRIEVLSEQVRTPWEHLMQDPTNHIKLLYSWPNDMTNHFTLHEQDSLSYPSYKI